MNILYLLNNNDDPIERNPHCDGRGNDEREVKVGGTRTTVGVKRTQAGDISGQGQVSQHIASQGQVSSV
ncbi:hypothetical protein J6590_006741 [Homalodisca vitripennis]|nr:hypothetical protein J6590_006741 [Homalodisca vitripennis]